MHQLPFHYLVLVYPPNRATQHQAIVAVKFTSHSDSLIDLLLLSCPELLPLQSPKLLSCNLAETGVFSLSEYCRGNSYISRLAQRFQGLGLHEAPLRVCAMTTEPVIRTWVVTTTASSVIQQRFYADCGDLHRSLTGVWQKARFFRSAEPLSDGLMRRNDSLITPAFIDSWYMPSLNVT